MFDINSDNQIDLTELLRAMKELDLETDEQKITGLFKDLDTNGDGTIDIDEFRRLVGGM